MTKLVPIRLGEPKEGQQHHNGAVDLPSNQSTTYQRNKHITIFTCRASRYRWTDTNQFTYSDQKDQKSALACLEKKSANDPHSSRTLVEGGAYRTAIGY